VSGLSSTRLGNIHSRLVGSILNIFLIADDLAEAVLSPTPNALSISVIFM